LLTLVCWNSWDFESYSVAKVLEVVEGSHVTALTTLRYVKLEVG
jgi:hypothetical protein